MSNNATSGNCPRNCWLIALAVGVLLAFYLMSASWGLESIVVVVVAVFVAVGWLAGRMFCSPKSEQSSQTAAPSVQPVSAPASAPEPAGEPVAKTAPKPVAKAAPKPETESTPKPAAAPAPKPASEPAQATADKVLLKPSAPLSGQADLASRKGTWRYQPEGAKPPAKAAKATKPAAKAPQDTSGQPAALAQARDGGADDLKLIKGVGPKLEGVLNGMGYFHFDQIASWGADDIEWTDQNLVGFKGRVSRDNWVDQAKALAAGEETEFAKRAKRDGIYD